MKYINFEIELDGVIKNVPIIFPSFLVHADMRDAIAPLLEKLDGNLVSAGEVTVEAGATHGHSETCGVKSRFSDALIITHYDYMHGIKI
jgi:hypothetical protein